MVVRPSDALSRADWTRLSDSVSKADVASSKSKIFGFRTKAFYVL